MVRKLLCYTHGRGSQWEAICVDLDIAVAGSSPDEVRRLLQESIFSYIECAMMEAPADRDRLLSRRAPLFVRLKLAFAVAAYALRNRKNGDGRAEEQFVLPCPA